MRPMMTEVLQWTQNFVSLMLNANYVNMRMLFHKLVNDALAG